MKNLILKNFLNEFKNKFEICEEDENIIFEDFIHYCVLNNHVVDAEKNFSELNTGDAKAIDGIAIIVNNRLILNEDDINILLENNSILSVEFIFIQSKTSDKLNDPEISYYLRHIKNFIGEEECTINGLEKFWELKNIIYSNSNLFKKGNPRCIIYYATASNNSQISQDIQQTINQGIEELNDIGMLDEDIKFYNIGAKEIQRLYRKIDAELEAIIRFPKNVSFAYEGNKITSAYFGLVDVNEYIKLLKDEETCGIKNVFEDNIRDFLGIEGNEVNKNMQGRLLSEEAQLFGILNNGITIVADDIRPVGEKFNLINYQIVNGCQTSNVLFENYDRLVGQNISIPIRIIATKDEKTRNEIVKATNSQTGLKPEQLDALHNFHKQIEEFYNAKNILWQENKKCDALLCYERRSNQYRNVDITQTRIINIPKQIKAVTSMFLDNPHGVSGHYGTVARNVKDAIFKDEDKPIPYYVSGLLIYRVEGFFRKNKEYKAYTKMKWHILMVIKYMFLESNKVPKHFNSKEMEKLANKIEKSILTEEKTNQLIISAIEYIKEMITEETLSLDDRKIFERKETTDKLTKYLYEKLELTYK